MNKKRISVVLDPYNNNTFIICKICNKKFTQITHTHIKHHNLTIDQYVEKFSLQKEDLYCADILKLRRVTLENMINRWGELDGKRKWEEYRMKQSHSNTFEYKHEKFGWSKEDFDNYNNSRAVTLNNMILRHGEKEGKQKWQNYCKLQETVGCKLEYFIEKYGKIEGEKKFNEINRSKSLKVENFIKKYGQEQGVQRWESYIKKVQTKRRQSILANNLFWDILKLLPTADHDNIFFEAKNHEYFFAQQGYKTIFVDFYDISKKKIIEFLGDYWHGNPEIYTPDFINNQTKLTAKELYEKTLERNSLLEKIHGCKVLMIWENDLLKDKDAIIKKCLQFLNETI